MVKDLRAHDLLNLCSYQSKPQIETGQYSTFKNTYQIDWRQIMFFQNQVKQQVYSTELIQFLWISLSWSQNHEYYMTSDRSCCLVIVKRWRIKTFFPILWQKKKRKEKKLKLRMSITDKHPVNVSFFHKAAHCSWTWKPLRKPETRREAPIIVLVLFNWHWHQVISYVFFSILKLWKLKKILSKFMSY